MSDVERLRAEQREAVRLLLRSPLVFVDRPDPAAFALVLRHADPLADFFRDTFGWTLLVDPRRRFARLAKRTFDRRDSTRGIWLRDRAAPFDPFRYALLCLACYELDALTGDQFLFSQVVDRLAAHKDPGLPRFDPVELPHRRALNDVFAWLEQSGVVVLRAGNAQRYFDGVDDDDPFYDLNRGVLAALLVTSTSPSLAADAEMATTEPYADTDRGRLDRVRHSVYRQIVDEPVVLDADLGPDERAYLAGQLGVRIREEVARWTGLSIERRAEGLAAIDEDGDLHDGYRLPAEGVLAHATLLLGEWLAEQLRSRAGGSRVVVTESRDRDARATPHRGPPAALGQDVPRDGPRQRPRHGPGRARDGVPRGPPSRTTHAWWMGGHAGRRAVPREAGRR